MEEQQNRVERKMLHWRGRIGRMKISCNPVTTLSSAIILWSIIIWSLAHDNSMEYLSAAKSWIAETWVWLYVLTQVVWTVFVIVIYFKFGKLKLGNTEDRPEFNNFTYFCMVFTTGIASGIYYSGVSDPIKYYHQPDDGLNYWGKTNSNQKTQNAINLTLYHWGLHGFSVYVVPALLIGILTYRKGLPLTMRTCLYPFLGNDIYGRIGDIVDILSILCIISGTAVSLAFGSKLLNAGLKEVTDNAVQVNQRNEIISLWILTTIATLSVLSGIHIGIRRLAETCFCTGALVLIVIILSDDARYIFSVFIQSVGFYLQYIVGTSLHTGVFTHSGGLASSKTSKNWMADNTLFWWGWWISWAPLAGVFIVRVSKGRTIKEVINYSFFLPTLFVFLWITSFAGIALDYENRAMNAKNAKNSTGSGKVMLLLNKSATARFYTILNQYEGISPALNVLAIISMVMYFATSSDSTSLVVDSIASNGEKKPPVIQRVFWALTEGAAGTALLFHKTLNDLGQLPVILAVPFTVIISLCCLALWRVLIKEPDWQLELEKTWKRNIISICSVKDLKEILLATFIPWYYLSKVTIKEKMCTRSMIKYSIYISFAAPFIIWILLLIMQIYLRNIDKFGWVMLILWMVYGANLRKTVRQARSIEGNIIEDLFLMMVYPLVIHQMCEEVLLQPGVLNEGAPETVNANTGYYDSDIEETVDV